MLGTWRELDMALDEVTEMLVVVKGGGDLGTGVAHRLFMAGLKVVILEKHQPTVLRRLASFAEAVYSRSVVVEGIEARRVEDYHEALEALKLKIIPVLVDEAWSFISWAKPDVVVDAIMARRNLGTMISDAPIVIGLGPGFKAEKDVHAVIETRRGVSLGRVIYEGEAEASTGVPEEIEGLTHERVLRAPTDGEFRPIKEIGDYVEEGSLIAKVGEEPIRCMIKGVIRGLLHEGIKVRRGQKIVEIDPTGLREYCYMISDRARAVGGGVLEAILHLRSKLLNKRASP